MPSSDYLRFDGKVAVVTGAGGGLGREYALLLASRGASVVVNDLGGSRSGSGKDSRAADLVVDEIRRAGGKAEANYDSVENGEAIIKTAIDKFGRIDILINNAGILRDRAFINISDDDWDLVHRVHLRGAYSVTKAAWPYLRKQNYGRVIFTSSNAGLFGNFGQTNYSSAKLGLIGLSKTLAIEGAKYQIQSNTIIPVAGSRLTEDVLPPNLFEQFKPKFVAPVVAWLCHESCPNTGEVFEAAGGWVGKYTWRRSVGKAFIPPETMSIEAVRDNWSKITNMDIATFPNSIQEQITQLVASVNDMEPPPLESSEQSHMNQDSGFFSYNTDNLILYALGVGVNLSDPSHLKYLNESHPDFAALPTFGVIPGLKAMFTSDMLAEAARKNGFSIDPTRVLHGEQYLEMLNPLPIDGSLKSSARIVDVLDKGSGALIIAEVDSQDTQGTPIYYNQFSIFLVGAGKFGGKRSSNNPQIKSIIAPPQRSPDAILTEQTSSNQAALYRLSGDKNPLHIDPNFAAVAGFNKPILHGLCSLGFATRHVLKTFANDDPSLFKAVKARFSGIIYPGETIRTEMWQEGERVFMRSTVVETGKTIIEGAYVDLKSSPIKMSPYTSDSNSSANMSADPFKDDEVYLVSDPIFEEIGRRIEMAPDVASKVNAIYEFSIFKDGKNVRTWVLDLKTSQKGLFSGNHKSKEPNCIIKISDEDMAALAVGELDPVKGFMEGQIKIVGDPGITQKLNYIFKMDSSSAYYDSQPEAKPEPQILAGSGSSGSLPSSSSISMAPGGSDGSGGDGGDRCKIDAVFENWAAQRLSEMKSLIPTIKTIYQWNITKGGKVVSVWTCDFKNGDGAIHRGTPKTGKPDCSLTIDDEFVCRIFEGKEDAMRAFMSGKLKIGGNILAAQKLQQLWAEEAPNVAAQLAKQRQQQSSQQTETSSSKTSSDDKDPDVEAIPTTGYKCDLIFSVFRNRCHEEPDFMKRLRVVFQFNVLRDGKPACVWTADNKSQPGVEVYRDVPKGVKPDCQITMEDEELLKVMVGKVNPQRLFMQGKVRVKGNIMLLQKLNSLWQEYQKLGKNPELPIAMDILLDDPLKVGLKSESAVIDLVQRIVRLPELLREAKGLHNLNITKDGKVVSQWIINLTGDLGVIKRGSTPNPVSTLTVDDYDLARLTLMKLHLSDAISQGRVKIEGDKEKAMKFSKLFSTPTSLKPKL